MAPHHVIHAFQEHTPLKLAPLHVNLVKLDSTLLYIIPHPATSVLLSVLLQMKAALTVPFVLLVIILCLIIVMFVLQEHTLPLIPPYVLHALLELYQSPEAKLAVQHAPAAFIKKTANASHYQSAPVAFIKMAPANVCQCQRAL
jgi:hypothetical protein